MKFVPRMLSILFMIILKWVVISPYAEHAQKLITRWLSMRENWLLASWAYEKIILAHHVHFKSFPSLPLFTHSSVPLSCPCLTTFVPSLTGTAEYLLADRRPGWKVKLVQVLDPVHKLLHFLNTDSGDRDSWIPAGWPSAWLEGEAGAGLGSSEQAAALP